MMGLNQMFLPMLMLPFLALPALAFFAQNFGGIFPPMSMQNRPFFGPFPYAKPIIPCQTTKMPSPASSPSNAPPPSSSPMPSALAAAADVPVDNRTIEQIYQAALAEGNGTLVVYTGGTSLSQGDQTKQDFERRFPGLSVDMVVDYSVFHGPRIDAQLANNSLIPDVVRLQTISDFPRWKAEGVLMQYKPANWSVIYDEYKDRDGFFTGTLMIVLGTLVNAQQLPESEWPRTAEDFLRPQFANGQIVAVHPNADDAILFYFKQVVDIYGLQFLQQYAAQRPQFVCGDLQGIQLNTLLAGNGTVAPAGLAMIPFANDSAVQLAFPSNNDPMTIAALYAAIFNRTDKPETAKLFLNWLLEHENSNLSGSIWTVRRDRAPLQGFPQIWELSNSNHTAFLNFLSDSEERERFKRQVDLYLGPTTCASVPFNAGINVQ